MGNWVPDAAWCAYVFTHLQRAAVRWMTEREQEPKPLSHPCLRAFTTEPSGFKVWGNTATGELLNKEPPSMLDYRGGLFCDEPGLGKTVTVQALIARTLGRIPSAPPDAEVGASP